MKIFPAGVRDEASAGLNYELHLDNKTLAQEVGVVPFELKITTEALKKLRNFIERKYLHTYRPEEQNGL